MRKASKPKHKFPLWARQKKDRWVWELTCRWVKEYGLYIVREWVSLKWAENHYCSVEDDMIESLNHMMFNGIKGLKCASQSEVGSQLGEWTDSWTGDDPEKQIQKAERQMQVWAAAEAKGTYRPKKVR